MTTITARAVNVPTTIRTIHEHREHVRSLIFRFALNLCLRFQSVDFNDPSEIDVRSPLCDDDDEWRRGVSAVAVAVAAAADRIIHFHILGSMIAIPCGRLKCTRIYGLVNAFTSTMVSSIFQCQQQEATPALEL